MATQAPARSPDLDTGPAVTETATASATAPAVRVSVDDTESSNNGNKDGNKDKVDDGITSGDNAENGSSSKVGDKEKADDGVTNFKPSPRFWAILITCAVIALLSALENTVVTTALPHIVADLQMGENYVWITNVFFLTGYVSGKPYRVHHSRLPLLWG